MNSSSAPHFLVSTLLAMLAATGCADLGIGPDETGQATIDFVTYPGEAEPGNTALFTLFGHTPTPCHRLTGVRAALDGNRIVLSARWRRPGSAEACPAVIEPFEVETGLEVPTGFDSLAVTVADSTWDHVRVLVDAPGFKKAAGELSLVGEPDDAPDCVRGLIGFTNRPVVLAEPLDIASPFVVGRLERGVTEPCADADLENVLGILEVKAAY